MVDKSAAHTNQYMEEMSFDFFTSIATARRYRWSFDLKIFPQFTNVQL